MKERQTKDFSLATNEPEAPILNSRPSEKADARHVPSPPSDKMSNKWQSDDDLPHRQKMVKHM
jgi:hypothetical protein